MNISQSLMNAVLDANCCPHEIKLNYVDKLPSEGSEAMLRGHVFEYKLLGISSSKDAIPELPKLQKGGISQAEKDIDTLVEIARKVMLTMGVDLSMAQKQLRIVTPDGLSGQLDMVAPFRGKLAIHDVKYTETKYDDRWNGWADLEMQNDRKRQARHYALLWHRQTGVWLPFYFWVFGKSGWVRVIKCTVTEDSMSLHEEQIGAVREMMKEFAKGKWKPRPSYEKCRDCYMTAHCQFMQTMPDIENYQI